MLRANYAKPFERPERSYFATPTPQSASGDIVEPTLFENARPIVCSTGCSSGKRYRARPTRRNNSRHWQSECEALNSLMRGRRPNCCPHCCYGRPWSAIYSKNSLLRGQPHDEPMAAEASLASAFHLEPLRGRTVRVADSRFSWHTNWAEPQVVLLVPRAHCPLPSLCGYRIRGQEDLAFSTWLVACARGFERPAHFLRTSGDGRPKAYSPALPKSSN